MGTASPVLVFDVNETLVDIEALAPSFERIFGDRRVLREWFGQLVTYSMAATLSGRYVDFFTLGTGVLRMLADVRGVEITDDDVARTRHAMSTMPAHGDVAEGLAMLNDAGFRLVTLTNSPPAAGRPTPLEHAGLAGFFERQFSVDTVGSYKPAPAVYRYVADQLRVALPDCMVVAAHVWDTIGAQAAGARSALITRPGNAPLPVERLPQPDVVAADLRALARRLIAGPA